MNNDHNISETREAYKNSDRIMKSANQRALDKKGARLIQEKNAKTGPSYQHRILKGIKENEIKNFNKEYNDYYQKCGFKNNYKALNSMNPFVKTNNKQITDGKCNNNRN
jgi:myosin-crossreactive antigen